MDFRLVFLYLGLVFAEEASCPGKCSCKPSAPKDSSSFQKMKCGGESHEKVVHLDELELLNFASELINLNISDNLLEGFAPKVELSALLKLDLSRNQITDLKENQFVEVPNLKWLYLTGNKIKSIDLNAFVALTSLERLRLNQNRIQTITNGTFDELIKLKKLDISDNPLACDCGLLWLLERRSKFKLVSEPRCASPPTFKGCSLRKLKLGDDIHCKSALPGSGFPLVDLRPAHNQVVFEGDSLKLSCLARSVTDLEFNETNPLSWTWLDRQPKKHFNDLIIDHHIISSKGLITSSLSIAKLNQNHSGVWSCIFVSPHGNHSKSVNLLVITPETQYCPLISTSNNKGSYDWPRTVVKNTVTKPCEALNMNYNVSEQKASYFCNEHGHWSELDTKNCSYTSDTTKILQQFSTINLASSAILESARHLKNFTANPAIFRDVMDLVFAVETVQNYLNLSSNIGLVGEILMDVVNNLLDLSKDFWREADLIQKTCGKMVNASEQLAVVGSSTFLHKPNLAIETFPLEKSQFSGMKCTWYVNPTKQPHDSLFKCVTTPHAEMPASEQGKVTEASITLPASLFSYESRDNVEVVIAMHASSKLFPVETSRYGRQSVTSAVVGAKLREGNANLTEPIYVMVRTPPSNAYEVTPFIPVRWEAERWTDEGCGFSHESLDYTVFSCNHFGYYGLMQEINESRRDQFLKARFKWSHPAIYVGSFILFASLLVVILTYLLCYSAIQMPKKAKHSLVNLWVAIAMLCFMYVFGIYQTEDVAVCQVVGMILHYLTLCSLLWMCVGVNCMYKRLSKNSDLLVGGGLQDDDLPSEQPIKKPILGLYLVGWGVGLIICGLSAAINMKEYASHAHCFLKNGPALSALYIPFSILTGFLSIFFLLIRCAIYNLDANGHLSEGTQATEHVDLDLLEPNFNGDVRSMRSMSTKTTSSEELEDCEHAPNAQLKAHLIFFLLYLMTWLSCAFSTVSPFKLGGFEEDFFSIAFGILATTLSAFTLFFYCVARNDVRTQWVLMTRFLKQRRHLCFRTRNISDLVVTQVPVVEAPVMPEPTVTSRSSSRASNQTKSNSHVSSALKTTIADLNGSFSEAKGAKINNVNLVVLHRAQYRSNLIPNIIENPTNAAEVFYNPHQSTVARKFFKRQKRNLLKKSINSASPVEGKPNNHEFGTSSKVNNTNIHVEQVRLAPPKNPNLLEEPEEEINDKIESNTTDSERFEGGTIRRRKAASPTPAEADRVAPSRTSSVSVSDLDELYQQIRRGPKFERPRPSSCHDFDISDDVETTV